MVKATTTTSKEGSASRDWTKGSLVHNILLLSWPMIILGVLYSANMILEMIWVGKLEAASIAGVGVAGFVVLLVISVKSGLNTGERAMVARYVGKGDIATANHIAGQSFVIAAFYGSVVTLIGLLFSRPIFSLFGLEAEVAAEGAAYLRIVLSGWLTEAFWMTSFSVMQASGDSVSPMKIAVVIRIVNAVLCPFLVLGWWKFPRMGVSGAAITYITVTGLGMCICLWVLFTGKTRLRLTWRDFNPDLKMILRILKVGLPASVMGMGKTFADLVLTWFLIPFGTSALAAHNILSRIELFINTPGTGMGTGASVMVGQNLGAGQPKRAARSGWLAMGLVIGFMAICCIVLLVWAGNIIRLFNVDPNLVETGVTFLRIAVAGYLGMSIVYIMQNCISGSGDTLPSMLITLTMLWAVMMPLVFILTRFTGLGANGVRWAIAISFTVGAIAFLLYFWRGRWKNKRV